MADQDTHVEVRMKVVSGKGEDSQWFDYRPGFFHDIVRVEWDLGTMDAALQTDAAEYLIRHGYAERLSPEQEPAPIVQEQEPLVVLYWLPPNKVRLVKQKSVSIVIMELT